MDDLTKLMLQDPHFIQALKDFEDRGFIKVKGEEGIEIIDKEGLQESQTHPTCLLYTSPSPRDGLLSRMPSSA